MSTNIKKNDNLPPLQKAILLHLAKNGPQTINQTVQKIKHSYHPSWIAFNSLEKKGVVKKAKILFYRGNKYPLYWLTEEGIIVALTEGASPTDLSDKSKEVYPENPNLTLALDMAPYINREVFKVLLTAITNKGKLEPIDLLSVMTVQMESDTTIDKFMQALNTYKKHPKEYSQFKREASQLRKNLNRLAENF